MASAFTVVALISAYNEADIVEQVVRDLIHQGIQVYFLDDGSTDGTQAIVEQYRGRGVLAVESQGGDPGAFYWERILQRKAELGRELDANWFIHHDADEFRESPWSHLSLRDAIQRVDALGFNAIDFSSLDFWPTHDDFRGGQDVREAFRFYSERAPYDRLQVRCWKKTRELVDLASTGGHEAKFAGRQVFPLRFILRHYPIRGQAHGERKVFEERRNRFLERERSRGWHVQYDDAQAGTSFIRDPSALTRYDADAVRVALTLRHRGVESLEEALGAARSGAERLRSELEARADELTSRASELEARTRQRDVLMQALDASSRELSCSAEELARIGGENAALKAKVAALAADLNAHARELSVTWNALSDRNADVLAHQAEMAKLRGMLDNQAVEIAQWRNALDDATRRLDDFHRSLSWRSTAPARAAYRLFKK